MDKELQMKRTHLEWPDPTAGVTVAMHRAAWDRLRLVCRELGFAVPTMQQVEAMADVLRGYDSHVLAANLEDGKPYLVNFDAGYQVENTPFKG